jgi:hypothetical protein
MKKKISLLLLFVVSSTINIFSQDWVPVLEGFNYNASSCRLAFSCYIKNNDDNSDADPTTFKIIIYNISDESQVFDTDVNIDLLKIKGSSPKKSWTIDLPALAGYRPSESYKIAIIANTLNKFEFDKKNNRVESPQFSCGQPSLNNAPAKQVEKEKSAKYTHEEAMKDHDEAMEELGKDMAAMKAAREQALADKKAKQENEKATLTSKVDNLNTKISKRIQERDQLQKGTKEWSDLAYEVAELEIEKKISETKLERVTDEIAYGEEGLSKSEKERYKIKLEKLDDEKNANLKNKKSGAIYGQTEATKAEKTEVVKVEKTDEKEAEEVEEGYLNNPDYSDASINNKSKFTLKKELTGFNMKIDSKKVNLKAKSAIWSQDKIAKTTKEIAELEILVQKYQNRIKELEGEGSESPDEKK